MLEKERQLKTCRNVMCIYMSVGVYVGVYLSEHPGFERLRLEAV